MSIHEKILLNHYSQKVLCLNAPNSYNNALQKLLEEWVASTGYHGTNIRCTYTAQPDRSKRYKTTNKKKNISDDVKCPFGIWFSIMNRKSGEKLPASYQPVRVTKIVTDHTCGLSTISHRLAKTSRGDNMKIPLENLRFVARLISANPNISTKDLRPHLKNYLPHYVGCTDVHCRSIRKKINNYYLTHGWDSQLDHESSNNILGKGAAFDKIDVDDAFVSKNLSRMLKQILRQDNHMWKAQRYCEAMKKSIPGYDYRIHVDQRIDEPDAILWVTPAMRMVLRRYPEILSLDMQKRQYNILNWPYCSLVFHSGHGKGLSGCECIVCEESHKMYKWIIETCADIEPSFQPQKIKMIYADNLITKELLVDLGIHRTCQLHCDYHHQQRIVWPKLFGSYFNKISDDLEKILRSDTENEFVTACNNAKLTLYRNQNLVQELDKIQKNPSYYAGYILKQTDGLMGAKTSAAVEQNHAGNVAYIGKGGNFEIVDQMNQHNERQQNKQKILNDDENEFHVKANRYKGKGVEPIKGADELARKTLNRYAFIHLWSKQLNFTKNLQKETLPDGTVDVWPLKMTKEESQSIYNLNPNDSNIRCSCAHRREYLSQCRHEIKVHSQFIKTNWPHRFYSKFVYETGNNICASLNNRTDDIAHDMDSIDVVKNEEYVMSQNGSLHIDLDCDNYNDDNDGDSMCTLNNDEPSDKTNLYCEAKSKAEEVCRQYQNSKKELTNFIALLDQIINDNRDGRKFTWQLHYDDINSKHNCGPRPSVTEINTRSNAAKRKKSISEVIQCSHECTKKRLPSYYDLSQVTNHTFDSSQEHVKTHKAPTLRNSKRTTKTCNICGRRGHTRLTCTLFAPFSGIPTSDEQTRAQLAKKISLQNAFINHQLLPDDERAVITKYKYSAASALVIHRRFPKDGSFIFECTVFGKGNMEPLLNKCMLDFSIVHTLLIQSRSRVIVNELIEDLSVMTRNTTQVSDEHNILYGRDDKAAVNNVQQQVHTTDMLPQQFYHNPLQQNGLFYNNIPFPHLPVNPFNPSLDYLTQLRDIRDI